MDTRAVNSDHNDSDYRNRIKAVPVFEAEIIQALRSTLIPARLLHERAVIDPDSDT